jgi:hypothetical protein
VIRAGRRANAWPRHRAQRNRAVSGYLCADMVDYFSERRGGAAPRDVEDVGSVFWDAFVGVLETCVADGSLAQAFPENCSDAPIPCGVDERALARKLRAHPPGLDYPLNANEAPGTLLALDAVEFFGRHVSRPARRVWHDFFRHHDLLGFDAEAGVVAFCEEVNTLFRRCGHPYELKVELPPHVERLAPAEVEVLLAARFRTGDRDLDELLDVASSKFRSPDPRTRFEGLEKLWDAFER